MDLVIDPSHYEYSILLCQCDYNTYSNLSILILKCLDDLWSGTVAQIWLNLLLSLPQAPPLVENKVNHSRCDFISYCVPSSPSLSSPSPSSYFTSTFHSPSSYLISLPSSSPPSPPLTACHPLLLTSLTLSNVGLHCCPNQTFV